LSNRLTTIYRESGFVGLLLRALNKLPGVDCVMLYYLYRISFEELDKLQAPPELRIKVVGGTDDLPDLLRIQDKADIFNERFSLGHPAVLAYNGETPVGYLWAQPGPTHTEQRYRFDIAIAPNELYYYDSFVLPEHRQQGVFKAMFAFLASQTALVSEFSDLTAIVEIDNFRSRKAHERLGFRADQLYFFAIILGKRMHKQL
jgi:GNAT superfamily N-acetyltransferase